MQAACTVTVAKKCFHIWGSEIHLILPFICVGKKQKEGRNIVAFEKGNKIFWKIKERNST
jgi:hypothetical protein